jgi:CubicO group peptidase (beta-lactamase class C family)
METKEHDVSTRKTFLLLLILLVAGLTLVRPAFSAAQRQPDFDAIDAFIERQMQRHRIPGLALGITHDGEIVHLRGFGDAGHGQEVTPQTPFFIGSVTKSFTALAVMQLVDAGQVELDTPVQTYIPWFQVADEQASETITVRHLLNQTSGLSDAGFHRPDLSTDTTLEESIRDLKTAQLTAPVGSKYQYFNLNYNALGLIVEYVSGQDFGAYLRDHIFTPLEMQNTFVSRQEAEQAGLAQGHNVALGFPLRRRQPFYAYDLPAGFVISTAEDMTHYLIAQNDGGMYRDRQILSPESVSVMHRPPAEIESSYAMAWDLSKHNGVEVIAHDGAVQTFLANATLLPEQGYGYVILINQNSIAHLALALEEISMGVTDLLLGREPSPGLAVRVLYALITVMILFDLGRHVRNLVRLSRGRVEARPTWRLILGLIFPVLLLVGAPLLLVAQAGGETTRVLLFSYMPGITAWFVLGVLLSLAEAVLRMRALGAPSQG